MTPTERLRIEKAAADCGFEMTPVACDAGLQLRSARFPETVLVQWLGEAEFRVVASSTLLPDSADADGSLAVQGYDALYEVLKGAAACARTMPNRVADAFRRETAHLPRVTEVERLTIERVGQGLYRAALLDYWQGRCAVTGLDVAPLLRASHIKPWASCASDDERLDVFNGLMLAPHVDALFDGGWISFADDGALLVSSALSPSAATCLGVEGSWKVTSLKAAHKKYLAHHRQCVFQLGNCGGLGRSA